MAACIRNPSSRNCFFSSSQIDRCNSYGFDLSRPTVPNLASSSPTTPSSDLENDSIWLQIREEAQIDSAQEPILSSYYHASILSHPSLESALANHLATKLSTPYLSPTVLRDVFSSTLTDDDSEIRTAVRADLIAAKSRDPACTSLVHCLLNFKGFQACQAHRVAHKLWGQGRSALALLIQNRVSEVFAVDIHPAAEIGRGVMLDHATGVVIGETAVVGNDVSIMHNVTLGGTGKVGGDRHPKIGDGVLVGAGVFVLGNVRVGEGAKIGAGSVVLKDVGAGSTVVGNPARLIVRKSSTHELMPSFSMDHTSFVTEWSDYVI